MESGQPIIIRICSYLYSILLVIVGIGTLIISYHWQTLIVFAVLVPIGICTILFLFWSRKPRQTSKLFLRGLYITKWSNFGLTIVGAFLLLTSFDYGSVTSHELSGSFVVLFPPAINWLALRRSLRHIIDSESNNATGADGV
jgi:hypothetical protein